MKKEFNNSACEIIDALGGTSETAVIFKIKPSSVSEWRRNGVPKARLMFLELARPEVLPNSASLQPACDDVQQAPSASESP